MPISALAGDSIPYVYFDTGTSSWETGTADATALTNGGALTITGWYYVPANTTVTRSNTITVSGEAHIILGDGSTLTVSAAQNDPGLAGINVPVGTNLTIYGQSNGTGILTANGNIDEMEFSAGAGIGGNYGQSCGTVTIHGGNVTARGATASSVDCGAAGIGGACPNGVGGTIIIRGGTVTATGGHCAAGIGGGGMQYGGGGGGGTVIISGGAVTATGGFEAADIGGGSDGAGGIITLSGGTLTVTGTDKINGALDISGGSLQYGSGTAPTINTISPATGSELVGNTITITGADFVAGSTIVKSAMWRRQA